MLFLNFILFHYLNGRFLNQVKTQSFTIQLLVLYFLASFYCLSAQECIDYGEFEGASCVSCAPQGWDIEDNSPQIFNPVGICQGSGPSPTGGNAVLLLTNNTGYSEAISTTVTGLTPGDSYYLAFWYVSEDCGGGIICCAELEVELDDETYTFPPETDWTLIEFCIIPESSSLDIVLRGLNGGASSGTIFLDDAACEDDACCVPEEPTFGFERIFCQTDDEFTFPTVSNEGIVGEWDLPSFLPGDYSGQTLSNTFTPDNDPGCDPPIELDVSVTPYLIPSFDFPLEYCRANFDDFFLPRVSLEGVEGYWNLPEIIAEEWPDGDVELVFTPFDLSCSEPIELNVTLDCGENLEFNLPLFYCTGEEIQLPDESEESIFGEWSVFFGNDLSPGFYTSIFNPQSTDCFKAYEYSFQVIQADDFTFDMIEPLCQNAPAFILDTLTLEGYNGEWSIPAFDPDTLSIGIHSSIWSPISNQGVCLKDTQIFFEIIEGPIPNFNLPTSLCALDDEIILPQISNTEMITGTWSIPTIEPSLYSGTNFTSVFTPDANFCAQAYTLTVQIIPIISPVFNIDTILCENELAFNLPVTSLNNLSGFWSNPIIDPQGRGGEIINAVFTPDDVNLCGGTLELNFYIEEVRTAEFSLPNYLCWDEADLILPEFSDNNIQGRWTNGEIIIEDNLGQLFQSEFEATGNSCFNNFIYNVQVVEDFDFSIEATNPDDCDEENGQLILTPNATETEWSINNGLDWQMDNIFSNLSPGTYTVWSRNSNYPDCISSMLASLSVPNAPVISDVDITHLTSCLSDNGSLTVNAQGLNLEYAILGGNGWQTSNVFSDLPAGNYLILVRNQNALDCLSDISAIIEPFPETMILDAAVTQPSDCLSSDGVINIIAEGQASEYSINNGQDWTVNNVFENLAAGVYDIIIRSSDAWDCMDERSVELRVPDAPEIISLEIDDPTFCMPELGLIEVFSDFGNVEFSLDGISWQTNNIFPNLEQGDYTVYLRDILNINCTDQEQVSLVEQSDNLALPFIEIFPMSMCDANDAIIEVSITANNPEFSLDGNSWQTSNVFVNLISGNYNLQVREMGNPDCSVEIDFEIENPDCPCEDIQVSFESNPSYCADENSGSIIITQIEGGINEDYIVSWDNGSFDFEIENLAEGWYAYTIIYDQNCIWNDSIYVEVIDPIILDAEIELPDCAGASNAVLKILATGGNGDYQFALNGQDYQMSNVFMNLTTGSYVVSVLDAQNCIQTIDIQIQDGPANEIILPEVININQGETVILNPQISASDISNFNWTPDTNVLNPGELVLEVMPTMTTEYTLIINWGSCEEVKTVIVNVQESPTDSPKEIYIANTFKPNSNSDNDRFFVQGPSDLDINLKSFFVYDRWGNLMFEVLDFQLNDPSSGWDGNYNNTPVEIGVYIYALQYELNGESQIVAGDITILR